MLLAPDWLDKSHDTQEGNQARVYAIVTQYEGVFTYLGLLTDYCSVENKRVIR